MGQRLDESLSMELLRKWFTGMPSNVPDPCKVKVSSGGYLVVVSPDSTETAIELNAVGRHEMAIGAIENQIYELRKAFDDSDWDSFLGTDNVLYGMLKMAVDVQAISCEESAGFKMKIESMHKAFDRR